MGRQCIHITLQVRNGTLALGMRNGTLAHQVASPRALCHLLALYAADHASRGLMHHSDDGNDPASVLRQCLRMAHG